jgi:hypothetical protein
VLKHSGAPVTIRLTCSGQIGGQPAETEDGGGGMIGRIGLAATLAMLLAWAGAPACAQFKIETPTDLAARMAYLMPSPADQAAQNAKNRSIQATPAQMRARGMAEAPAVAAEAGLDCHVDDARWMGDGEGPHGRRSAYYEVACGGDLGFVLTKTKGAPAQAITCLEAALTRPGGKRADLRCKLPENLDQRIGLVQYIARTGKNCAPERVRAIGHSDTHTAFELACRDGEGFVMLASSPPRLDRPIEIHPCLSYPAGAVMSCVYTDRQAQLAVVDRLAAQAGIACGVKSRAYVGESERDSFWEVACDGGQGWLLKQGLDGGLARAVDCASADRILAGGCRLTDTRQAQLEAQLKQAAAYTRSVRAAGFDCQVSAYAPHAPGAGGAKALEFACANRAAGAIAFFPATGSPSVVDCAHVQLLGYHCSLSPASAAYPGLTADLRALGKTTCEVADARAAGLTAGGHAYAEVACADGFQGFMVEYALDPIAPVSATVCAEARAVGEGCVLPRNRRE